MSAEPQLPPGWSQEGEDPILSAGMSIAMQWRHLGTDKLEAALKALEPELRRQHKAVMTRLGMQREAADRKERERRSELEACERQERRSHVRHMADLTVGAVVALAMLGAGVYVAADAWWLATLLCGPSLLALVKIFVLRRSDPDDMKFVARTARTSTNTAQQAQGPPPAV
ncbi:hypothetical protein AB0H92_49980 [Streptomyces phaeochromogenes]|uniref:hypothetical protein n=1 Tax=Streptomyces phaeochromogenes TaxID=1923 RepID=UPI00340FB65B